MREGLRKSTAELLHKLRRRGAVFTFRDALEVSGYDRNYLKLMLHRLERGGWIERIEKGKYVILPLEAERGRYTLHEFVIGSTLVKPSTIAYWSALHYHGLTEQIPNIVFIQTTSRKKRKELTVFGIKYRIIRVVERKFFGLELLWIEELKVHVTDREKTIIDCLDKPQYCGGVIEVYKALGEEDVDVGKLSEYLEKFGSGAVAKRLVYLAGLVGLEVEVPGCLIKKGIVPLDPTMPRRGKVNHRLKLLINVELEE
ncbi:MAG: type IV toxin-antitoxin system AbiEi family antitoxin domain-containing protein [archaeon GB-1845-036]|nr:type IV toxin-antitoxin system AbiEi family antitoxin domain-containing protein [Candidatus Culexmicrobium thermophilum]